MLVALTSAALQVQLVTQFDSVSATVSGSKLGGTFGDAVEGMSYATLGVGGLAFFTYLYAQIFARGLTEKHEVVIEAHGGY